LLNPFVDGGEQIFHVSSEKAGVEEIYFALLSTKNEGGQDHA